MSNIRLVAAATGLLAVSFAAIAATPDGVNSETLDKALIKPVAAESLTLLPQQHHEQSSQWIYNYLKNNHYTRPAWNNDLSKETLKQLIKLLDNNKYYFVQSDVDTFQQYKNSLDDAVASGQMDPAYDIFEVFQRRWDERYDYAVSLVDGKNFDFTKDESFMFDREEATWAGSRKELDELWRKRVKNDALNLRLAGKSDEEVSEMLVKRYENSKKRMRQTKSEDVFSFYMNAVTQAIEPHTSYLSPRNAENFNIDMKLSLEGIGAVLQTDEVYTKIVRIIAKGPADRSGELKADDQITGVGQGESGEMVDVIGWRLDDVVDLIRGPAGSVVRIQYIPANSGADGVTKTIAMERDQVKLEEQAASSKIINVEDGDQNLAIGVIELPKFYIDFAARYAGERDYRSTTRDVRKLIGELTEQGIDGIILDLRNNGGGALDEAAALTGLFIDNGPVVQGRDYRGRVRVMRDPEDGVFYSGPLAVMVNSNSASASEIVAGAIQDYQRGLVIGEQTYGKGTIQSLLDLNNIGANEEVAYGHLKFTTEKFYRITGGSTQHRGVIPDITFPSFVESEEYGESAYENALEWDEIKPAAFKRLSGFSDLVPELSKRHASRITENEEFKFLDADIKKFKELQERNEVSLNLADREQQRVDEEAEKLARENQRRFANGLKPLEKLDEDVEEVEVPDYRLQEGANILADLIKLKPPAKRVAQKQAEEQAVN